MTSFDRGRPAIHPTDPPPQQTEKSGNHVASHPKGGVEKNQPEAKAGLIPPQRRPRFASAKRPILADLRNPATSEGTPLVILCADHAIEWDPEFLRERRLPFDLQCLNRLTGALRPEVGRIATLAHRRVELPDNLRVMSC